MTTPEPKAPTSLYVRAATPKSTYRRPETGGWAGHRVICHGLDKFLSVALVNATPLHDKGDSFPVHRCFEVGLEVAGGRDDVRREALADGAEGDVVVPDRAHVFAKLLDGRKARRAGGALSRHAAHALPPAKSRPREHFFRIHTELMH